MAKREETVDHRRAEVEGGRRGDDDAAERDEAGAEPDVGGSTAPARRNKRPSARRSRPPSLIQPDAQPPAVGTSAGASLAVVTWGVVAQPAAVSRAAIASAGLRSFMAPSLGWSGVWAIVAGAGARGHR